MSKLKAPQFFLEFTSYTGLTKGQAKRMLRNYKRRHKAPSKDVHRHIRGAVGAESSVWGYTRLRKWAYAAAYHHDHLGTTVYLGRPNHRRGV